MMFGHRNGNGDRGGQGVPVEATRGLFWAWVANDLEELITMGPWSRADSQGDCRAGPPDG